MYNFKLRISTLSNGAHYSVNPRYNNGATKTIAPESDEMFHRETWAITFTFQRAEFDLIYDRDINTEFIIKAYESETDPLYAYVWAGRFTKNDCNIISISGKTLTVQPETIDRYYKIIKSLDKEFDLIKLSPAITPINIKRQAVIQVYVQGSTFVNNYISGVYWETPCEPTYSSTPSPLNLVSDFHFGFVDSIIFVPGSSDELSPDVSGVYSFPDYISQSGQYQFVFNIGANRWEILDLFNASSVVYQAPVSTSIHDISDNAFGQNGAVFTSVSSSSECKVFAAAIFARILTNKTTIGGTPTEDYPANDFTGENPNYTKVFPLDNIPLIGSSLHDITPTRYGKFDDDSIHYAGKYFQRPAGAFPISRSRWTECSYWFTIDATLNNAILEATEDILIEHAYKLPDVIKVLMHQIDPDIYHDELNDFSNFLYGTNGIRGDRRYPMITPKTNVTIGTYDKPATTAKIKLSEILIMLRFSFNVFWYIDQDDKLRLEHFDFFYNGGQYNLPLIGTDLTGGLEPMTGFPWGYALDGFTYDKVKLPQEIRFSWMDKQSYAFEGSPVKCLDNYADQGNNLDLIITQFSSDLDFIMANASDISKDGFVLFDAELHSGDYSAPFADLTDYGYDGVLAQNGYLSFAYLIHQYHRHGLPTINVNINDIDTVALTTIRTKVQEVEFPKMSFDPMKLITTSLGTGKADEFQGEINGGGIKGKIKIETT